MEGKIIGRFRLGKAIREGSLSTVYRAEETLGSGERRPAALKLIASPNPKDGRYVETALREAAIQRRFAGLPGILEVIDAGEIHGQIVWVAMELASGSLADLVKDEPAEPAMVIDMLSQVLKGLDRLHAFERAPVLHRDIKPTNILLVGSNRAPQFALSDIELAGEDVPPVPCCPKRARYLAPEFCGADARHESPASDIYSLGLVAYHMLLGNRLFDSTIGAAQATGHDRADVGAWMQWHCSPGLIAPAAQTVVPVVPRVLSDVLARMIAKPLDQRYAAALDVLRDLTASRAEIGRGVERAATDVMPQPSSRHRNRRAGVAVACVALASGLLTTCAWAWSRPAPTLSLDPNSTLVGYGKQRLVRVKAQQLPDRASVMLEIPGVDPRALERVQGSTQGIFETTVDVSRVRRIEGSVIVMDESGERVASRPIVLERLPPIDVSIETAPAVPNAKILVRTASGDVSIEELTDGQGRAKLKLEPGDYKVALEGGGRFEVAGLSVSKRVSDEDAEADLAWKIPVTSLDGKLKATVSPANAQVRLTSTSKGTRSMLTNAGVGELVLDAGEWEVSAEAEGYTPAVEKVLVPKGGNAELAIVLRAIPTPPPPVAPPPPPAPEPMPAEQIKVIAKSLLPIEQLEFTVIDFSGQVRVSGCVATEEERALLSKRLKPIVDRTELEVRVDPELIVERIREELRKADVKFVTGKIRCEGGLIQVAVPKLQAVEDAPAKVRAIMGRFLLEPERAKIRWYEL